MDLCKWCRESIIPGWENLNGKLIADWIHVNGTSYRYTCYVDGKIHWAEPMPKVLEKEVRDGAGAEAPTGTG